MADHTVPYGHFADIKGEGAPYSDKVIFQNALNELRIVSKGFPKLRQAPINPELNFESTIFSNDFQPSIF